MKQKGNIWIDQAGKEIDTWAINPILKIEEKHAQKVIALAFKAEKALIELDKQIHLSITEVFQAKLKDAEMKEYKRMPTPKSLSFYAFDKSVFVDVKTSKKLSFDKTYVSIVKNKFDEFFKVFDGNQKDSDKFAFLRGMIDSVLYKNDSEIDQTSVNELRGHKGTAQRLKFEGWELFVEAVDLFDKAIRTESGNQLYYIDVADENGKMRRVALKYTDI